MKFLTLDTIQKRVITAISFSLVVLCIAYYIIFKTYMVNNLATRETEKAEHDAILSQLMLNSSVEPLPAVTRDWSSWDLTYSYLLGENDGFPDETITEYPFQLHKIDICAIIDLDAQVLLEKNYDFKSETFVARRDDLTQVYQKLATMTQNSMKNFYESNVSDTLQFGAAGYGHCGNNWYYFTAYPVLPSDEDKPAVGTFIFARVINQAEISRITKDNQKLTFQILDPGSEQYAEVVEQAEQAPEQTIFILDDPSTFQRIPFVNSYATAKDIFDENYLIINVTASLDLYHGGLQISNFILYGILVVSAVILALIIILLRILVLVPLRKLSTEVGEIGSSTEMTTVDTDYSGYEFSSLANIINDMVQRLEKSRYELEKTNRDLVIYKQSITSATDGIIIYNGDGYVEYVNPAFNQSMGYADGEVLESKKSIKELIFNLTHGPAGEIIKNTVDQGKPYSGEITMLRKDGTKSVDDIRATPLMDEEGGLNHVVVIKRNIEEKKKYEELLQQLAHYDSLTGLPNRVNFTDQLKQYIAEAKEGNHKTAMFFLDLNNFKLINDTMGHGSGDQLLKKVANRIVSDVPALDCVSRMGGDEFTAIIRTVQDSEQVACIAQEILAVFDMPFQINSRSFQITTSLGSSIYPDDGDDEETLIRNSDTAMYKAKSIRKNFHQPYTRELYDLIALKMTLEHALREALQRNEFVAYFQPKISTETNRIFGSEALIRWNSPKGLILPDQFIPLSEETGLIIPITRWMLKESCIRNKEILDCGIKSSVAVNISSQVMQSNEFFDMIEDALETSQMPANYLDIEITEGTLIIDSNRTIFVLQKLRDMGISISIDDFGTGYSSLSYLRKFPISRIKIDRSFVMETPHDAESRAIVQAIIAMSHGLNLTTTAEGIETLDQLDFLKKLGCEEGQGYLVSRPIPMEEYKDFLYKWNKGKD